MNNKELLCNPDNLLPAIILLLLAAVMPFYTWHQDTSGFLTDDGLYLLMADFFSPWYDGNIYVDYITMKHARFPPAFPVLLSLFGGGSRNMGAAHLVTGACMVFSALAFFIWSRRNLTSKPLATACLVLFIILPESPIYVLELRSEFLYLVFLFAALLVMESSLRHPERERELLCLASILVGLCIQTRTIGVALLAAFLVYLFVNGIRRKWLYGTLAATLPACWYLIKSVNGYSSFYMEDVASYNSYEDLRRLVTEDVPLNGRLLLESWNANLGADKNSSWLHYATATVLLIPAAIGFACRIRRHNPDAYYVVFYIAIILVWPHPDHMVRFIYPLMPIGIVYVFTGLSVAAGAGKSRSWLCTGAVLAMLSMSLVPALAAIDRYNTPVPPNVPDDFRYTRWWLTRPHPAANRADAEAKYTIISFLKSVPGSLEQPHECMYAAHTPFAMLYSGRPARSLPIRPSVEKLYKCRYLFVMNLVTTKPALYPLNVIDQQHLQRVATARDSSGRPQAYLFRIRR